MFNKLALQSLVASAVLGLTLMFSASDASAQKCDKNCKDIICHNIGGPMELGANCDGATGECTFTDDFYGTVTVAKDHFLGIINSFNQDSNALAAHLAHGDGFVIMVFDPPLHLASTGQNHEASNVECLAKRAITVQPPEPGN